MQTYRRTWGTRCLRLKSVGVSNVVPAFCTHLLLENMFGKTKMGNAEHFIKKKSGLASALSDGLRSGRTLDNALYGLGAGDGRVRDEGKAAASMSSRASAADPMPVTTLPGPS